jgi:hypothetical protein
MVFESFVSFSFKILHVLLVSGHLAHQYGWYAFVLRDKWFKLSGCSDLKCMMFFVTVHSKIYHENSKFLLSIHGFMSSSGLLLQILILLYGLKMGTKQIPYNTKTDLNYFSNSVTVTTVLLQLLLEL